MYIIFICTCFDSNPCSLSNDRFHWTVKINSFMKGGAQAMNIDWKELPLFCPTHMQTVSSVDGTRYHFKALSESERVEVRICARLFGDKYIYPSEIERKIIEILIDYGTVEIGHIEATAYHAGLAISLKALKHSFNLLRHTRCEVAYYRRSEGKWNQDALVTENYLLIMGERFQLHPVFLRQVDSLGYPQSTHF